MSNPMPSGEGMGSGAPSELVARIIDVGREFGWDEMTRVRPEDEARYKRDRTAVTAELEAALSQARAEGRREGWSEAAEMLDVMADEADHFAIADDAENNPKHRAQEEAFKLAAARARFLSGDQPGRPDLLREAVEGKR